MQEVINRKRLYSSPWVNLEKVDLKLPSGKIIEHNYVDAVNNSVGAVVLKDDKIVMVKNFRFSSNDYSLEIPGGWILDGEMPLQAVKRKVESETGFMVDKISRLGEGKPWLGISNKEHYYFLVNVGQKMLVKDSDFIKEVKMFNFHKIENMIRRGDILDQSTLTALFLAKLHKNL